ncbi:MAG TPA: ABC transporter ATP-binding protein [Spirochaetales bacterium]|nr:ABC transporter ATP-binding protein [Spirochaetales bacterium]
MARLKIVNLTKRFDDVVAVDNMNLEVEEGEFITLLGPSGCGKTTTLRSIAGFLPLDEGEIYFNDRLMNNIPPYKRSTAMCFQSYALFPHMTVQDNIRFGLRMQKVPIEEQTKRIDEILNIVGLKGLEHRKPAQLSGGQQQRVALARAVVIRPEILLFDEPLSNLDAKLRERVRVEIRELQKRLKITAVYVTHDQAEALVISDRIVIMNEGRIEQVGDPFSIYRSPISSFVPLWFCRPPQRRDP